MPLKKITTEKISSQVTAEQVRNFLERESPDLLNFLDGMREAFGDIQVTKLEVHGLPVREHIKEKEILNE